MNNCNCETKYIPGRKRIPHVPPCPYQGGEPIPPFKPTPKNACGCKPSEVTLRTVTIPANLGDDTGEYAPKPGAYFNTIVHYIANDAVYIYDSNGVFTKIYPDGYAKLVETVDGFEQAMNELYNPGKIGLVVGTTDALAQLSPTAIAADEYVYVVEDSSHNNRPSLYEYSASAGEYVYVRAASPYYEKPFIDNAIEALQTNINNVMNKEVEDVENLQTNINAEVNARTEAVAELDQRIEDIVNSPDVRYIVDTYADLEALDKSTIGDQDYARVLQDETHDNASTYYQYNKTASEWAYIGQTGPYYTREQVDERLAEIDTTKLDELADIKTIGENLELTEEGVLNATGGSGGGIQEVGLNVKPITTAQYLSSSSSTYTINTPVTLEPGTYLLTATLQPTYNSTNNMSSYSGSSYLMVTSNNDEQLAVATHYIDSQVIYRLPFSFTLAFTLSEAKEVTVQFVPGRLAGGSWSSSVNLGTDAGTTTIPAFNQGIHLYKLS